MCHHQLHQSNSFSHRLKKFMFLVAEAASITAVVTVFAATNKVYADNKPIPLTSMPSLQEFLRERGTLKSVKDLGIVEVPTYDPRRPCYVGELAGCVLGGELINPETIQKLNESFNSTRMPGFNSNMTPTQLRLFEVPL